MFLTQTAPFIIKPVDVRFNCSFPPNPESLTTSKLNDFSVHINSSKKVWKSEFDYELLSYLNNNRRMLGIIRKIVKFSVK